MKTKIPFAGRCLWLCTAVMGISITVAFRLVELQVIDSQKRGNIAREQLIERETIPAERGIIMDRNEEILTNNLQSAELIADRYHLREVTLVVDGLAYNQVSNSEAWKNTTDPAVRRRLFSRARAKLLESVEEELTLEERAARRREIMADPNRSARIQNYDPVKVAELFRAHDELVAEIIHPFLRHIEIKERVEIEPERTITRRGRTITIPAKYEERAHYTTREDIINLIAQPEVEAFNREAEANGSEERRRYRMEILLARGLPVETADQIREALRSARVRGVQIKTELRRSYVMPEMLSHVLGYVDARNEGTCGVEGIFNSYLAGTDGLREYRHNARGQVLPNEDDRYLPPKHGLNLRLTIDMRLQAICEQELDRGMRHFRARRGCMIVVDPRTGDILAMVSRPAINLNTKDLITHEGTFSRGTVRDDDGTIVTGDFNFACQTRYEPGSTFKVVAVTTAVDNRIMGINTPVSCHPLPIANSRPVTDNPYNYGVLTVGQTLKKSSNPGAARIAIACKWANYHEYVQRFGLTESCGVDLPSGGACRLANGTHLVNFSRIAYGYSVSVSPLHMAMVYATIANDGIRMRPRLIDSIIAADGSVYDPCPPQEVCRVMSPSTARAIRGALETVTEKSGPAGRGTATRAAIPGFRIGGKTGTAKKNRPGGGYYEGLYTVSFAGVLPIDNPRLVVMTVIDEPHPRDCGAGGGTVAAPIFRAAAERFIKVLNLQPSDPEAYEKYLEEQAAGNNSREQ